MITTCTICQASYQLDGTKVPRKIIRVRCPACSGIFVLDGTAPPMVTEFQVEDSAPAIEPQAAAVPDIPEVQQKAAVVEQDFPIENNDTWEIPAEPAMESFEPAPETIAEPVVESPPVAVSGRAKRRRSKEEMLARALVSDILVYNRDLRDTAIQEGKLLEVLGGEIKKSWELYKEKVTPDVANSTNHFREALNEILAEGEKVF